jgi:hypothetical protein
VGSFVRRASSIARLRGGWIGSEGPANVGHKGCEVESRFLVREFAKKKKTKKKAVLRRQGRVGSRESGVGSREPGAGRREAGVGRREAGGGGWCPSAARLRKGKKSIGGAESADVWGLASREASGRATGPPRSRLPVRELPTPGDSRQRRGRAGGGDGGNGGGPHQVVGHRDAHRRPRIKRSGADASTRARPGCASGTRSSLLASVSSRPRRHPAPQPAPSAVLGGDVVRAMLARDRSLAA